MICKPATRGLVAARSGFTLMELLVVLMIVGLLAAFVAPRITAPLGGLQLKTAAKKIISAMRYARSQSVSQQHGRVAIFDFEMRRMVVFAGADLPPEYRPDDLPLEKAEMRYELPPKVFFEQAFSGDEEIVAGLFQVAFFPNGSSTGGELILANEKGRRFGIEIDFITGLAHLEEING